MFVRTHRFSLPSQQSLNSLQREMEGFFGRFLNDSTQNGDSVRRWHASVAMWDNADKIFLELELPGVTKDSIDITTHNGVLKISGERKQPEGDRNYWVNERHYGAFERSVSLPDDVDADTIDAEFVDGVLRVQVSKKPESQPKKIAVRG